MRVLHITASYKPAYVYGGPVFSLSALAEALAQQGVTTHVFTTNANGDQNLDVDTKQTHQIAGVSVRYYKRYLKGFFFSPALMRAVWKYCKTYDIVHINSWWNVVSVSACMICLWRGVSPVLSLRGTMSDFSFNNNKVWIKRFFHQLAGRHLLGRCRIHFTGKGELENAKKWFTPASHFILNNVTDIPPMYKPGNSASDNLEITFLGRLHPIKNLEMLFEAMKGFDFPCILKVYGQGEAEYVTKLKSEAGENVRWMGWVEGDDKFNALRSADIFILISQYENFGNVLVEALSQGTAVICAQGIGISDFIEDNDLGWTVIPKVDEIRNVITSAWKDKEKRRRIRETASRIVMSTFSAHVLGAEYVREYQETAEMMNPVTKTRSSIINL